MISPVKVWRRGKTIRDLLGKEASIISWTKIYSPPPDFKHIAPYIVVFIQLVGGQKLCAQLVDCKEYANLKVGEKVVVTIRKLKENLSEEVIPYTIACKQL